MYTIEGESVKRLLTLLTTLYMTTISIYATVIVEHKVKKGETLYSIAHQHHTTIDEVRQLNGLDQQHLLHLGMVLQVPEDTYEPDEKAIERLKKRSKILQYQVQEGDTLYRIAHQHYTTIDDIIKRNHLKKSEVLKPGRILTLKDHIYFAKKKYDTLKVVKTSKSKIAPVVSHTITQGETLYSIAHQHHTTIDEVRALNHLKKGEVLKLGRVLQVPQNTYHQGEESRTHLAGITPKKVKKKLKVKKKSASRVAKVNKKRKIQRVARTTIKPVKKRKSTLSKRKKRGVDAIFAEASKPHKRRHHKVKKQTRITALAKQKLGKPYVWGATGKNKFDCSGLTTYVYKKNGIHLPRRAIAQSKVGRYVSRNQLRPGDLIFFDTSKRRRGYVNHVGIYIGNGQFIHASSAKKRVVITSLNKPFYSQRFKGGRRVTSSS